MLNPILWLTQTALDIVEMALIVWIVMGLLIAFNVVNRWHPLVGRVYDALSQLFEPLLRPIRRYIPTVGGFDLSPVVLILLLQFVQYTITWLFVRGAF